MASGEAVMLQTERIASDARLGSYQPALDGVRTVAVAGVLAFHQGFAWASGGFLGVSVFFTLSGFLITGLLVRERERSDRVALVQFYDRRIRRLVPAAVVCIGFVVLGARAGWWGDNSEALTDARWSLANVQNWNMLWQGQQYSNLFEAPSPLTHFWSLAIEEQFYIVWPIVMIVLFRRLGSRPNQLGRWLWVLTGCAGVAAVGIAAWGPNATYLSSPARAAELLAGAALAVTLGERTLTDLWKWIGGIAAVLIVVAMSKPSDWAYHGGLPVFALLSVALIAGLQVDGSLRRLLGTAPLALLGRYSYGIYLYHWPIFLLLTTERTSLGGTMLFAARVTATLAVAAISYRFLERPIRSKRPIRPALTLVAAAVTIIVGIAAIGLVVPARSSTAAVTNMSHLDPDVVAAAGIAPSVALPATPPDGDRALPESSAPVLADSLRVLVVGDSTAVSLGAGLIEHAAREGSGLQVTVDADGACGIVRGGEYELDVLNASLKMSCPTIIWDRALSDVTALQPDIVVVNITLADTWDRSWDGGRTWLTPTDAEYAQRISDDYASFVDSLIVAGADKIVWLRPPISYTDGRQSEVEPSFANGGQAVVETTVDDLAAQHRGVLETIDYAAWFETTATGRDRASRPDGIHMTQHAATEAAGWLTPRLRHLAAL